MSNSFEFNEILSFKISSAQIWYGDSPTVFGFRNPRDELKETKPTIHMNLICKDYEIKQLLGKGSAVAYIHRHLTDKMRFKDGIIAKGVLCVNVSNEDEEKRYLEVAGILPEYSFDNVAYALTLKGNELLTNSYLVVGLNQPRSQIHFAEGDGLLHETSVFVELLAIRFEIGEKTDDSDEV